MYVPDNFSQLSPSTKRLGKLFPLDQILKFVLTRLMLNDTYIYMRMCIFMKCTILNT